MSDAMHDDATRAQIEAAHPGRSTWLAANAGSGKTRVLTDRVARLLLHGVLPQNILCLTYTKAAASEMQNRLFARLGEWAMLDDDALRTRLAELGEDISGEGPRLDHARTLFARAIETPGGLRIQTIHAFCAALLRRFPLEAGISPLFRELEEQETRALQMQVLDEMAEGPHRELVVQLGELPGIGADLPNLLSEISGKRAAFADLPPEAEIWRAFGASAQITRADIAQSCFAPGDEELIRSWIPVLQSGGTNDCKAADKLAKIAGRDLNEDMILPLADVLLTKSGKAPFTAKIGSLPSKGLRKAHPELTARLNDLMQRIERARGELVARISAEQTVILHRFASQFLAAYTARKQQLGVLDFDDLIEGALRLLEDESQADWIRFRLDGGMDHILIDEAQDTSPRQWRLIDLLAQDLGAGEGARPGASRSIFVVGDFKQSIFSFQGAAPEAFREMSEKFRARLVAIGEDLQSRALRHSFRSAPAVLEFVDTVFAGNLEHSLGEPPAHLAFHEGFPGRVDLWPAVPEAEKPQKRPWHEPLDSTTPDDPKIQLAHMIAQQIAHMVRSGTIPAKNGPDGAEFRKIRPGDFLILVQRRELLFNEIIRACMAHGLPVAGADQLDLGEQLAVQDLVALLSFLALPQDDLSLAAALRSPLFGLSEEALYSVCHDRPDASLWESLKLRRDDHPQLVDDLEALLNATDFLTPFGLLERVLTRLGGRRRMLARLGAEAEDGIDSLLGLALQYERQAPATLSGFLGWLNIDDIKVKRQLADAGDRIRVMTVHGAKGLESPIVILPEMSERKAPKGSHVVDGPERLPLFKAPKNMATPLQDMAQDQARSREMAERNRLFYVAMTRAESWLILCAAGNVKDGGENWHAKARAAMDRLPATKIETPAGEGQRFQLGRWQEASQGGQGTEAPGSGPALPAWAQGRPAPPAPPPPTWTASQMEGPKSMPEEGLDPQMAAAARAHGTAVHLLLEHLPAFPAEMHEEMAAQLLGESPQTGHALKEVQMVLSRPDLGWIFASEGLSEVDLAARQGGRVLRGTVDRLIVSQEKVIVIDFKTNRIVPACPEETPLGILRQMGVYCSAIAQIYPGRDVDLRILWTAGPTLMRLPRQLALDSLAAPGGLDRDAPPS